MRPARPQRPLHHFVVPLPRVAGEVRANLPRLRGRGTRRVEGALGACAVFLATPALAHEGHHEHLSTAQALDHLLTQPDHQLAFAGLIVAIVTGGWVWTRALARK